MNVEIRAEAALFPEKEYISEIFIAVWGREFENRLCAHFSAKKTKTLKS
jgi:hypothetical protein